MILEGVRRAKSPRYVCWLTDRNPNSPADSPHENDNNGIDKPARQASPVHVLRVVNRKRAGGGQLTPTFRRAHAHGNVSTDRPCDICHKTLPAT